MPRWPTSGTRHCGRSRLPEDFEEASGDDMARFYDKSGFSLLDNCWLMLLAGEPVAAAVLFPRCYLPRSPSRQLRYVCRSTI